jgi:hypothetical protein
MAFLPALAAGAAVVKGVGGLVSGIHNRKNFRRQARDQDFATNQQVLESGRDARKAIGTQLAAQWGNGLEGGSGSALDALRESELNAAADAAEIRRQGGARSASLRAQGKQALTGGIFDAAGGMLDAASSYGGMKSDWAQAGRDTSAPRSY